MDDKQFADVMRRIDADPDGLDYTSDEDRTWFETNKGANFRIRNATDHERNVGTHPDQVLVCQMEPGARVRIAVMASGFDFDTVSDEVCWALFEYTTSSLRDLEFYEKLRFHMSKKLKKKEWKSLERNNPIAKLMSERMAGKTRH